VLAPNEVLSSVGDFISRQVAELIVINSVCVVGPTQQRFNFLLQSLGYRPHPILSTPSAVSLDALRQRLLDFIDYFNCTMAKPYRWTYTGQPLKI
jgi:hypothetical protein